MEIKGLIDELSNLKEVEAIALGGSRASTSFDDKSDYDVYVYCTSIPNEENRKNILNSYCQYMEIGNHFWELEDNVVLLSGTEMDIIYRNLDDFRNIISYVVDDNNSYNGYTTCMWHNLIHSKILYDEKNRLHDLQAQYTIEYPDTLKENIVGNNMRLLNSSMPAYYSQIRKAIMRNDLVSVNHRVAAFLESYFDIIFAMNKQTHPGEKRMVEWSLKVCECLPVDFEKNLDKLFNTMYKTSCLDVLNDMIENLRKVIE